LPVERPAARSPHGQFRESPAEPHVEYGTQLLAPDVRRRCLPPTRGAPSGMSSGPLYELSQILEDGSQSYFRAPALMHVYRSRLGDFVRGDNVTIASDVLVTGLHAGTHVDALSHVGVVGEDGVAHARADVPDVLPPFFNRGVLIDVSALCEDDFEIDSAVIKGHLDAHHLEIRPHDVVLIHTGWGSRWGDVAAYGGADSRPPGLSMDGAAWLAERRVAAVGSDTPALEPVSTQLGVHRTLLYENGVYIFETLSLAALAADGVREFWFIALPLRLRGATGSPVRAIAVAPSGAHLSDIANAVIRGAIRE
jgi:kynurenine formamidase